MKRDEKENNSKKSGNSELFQFFFVLSFLTLVLFILLKVILVNPGAPLDWLDAATK